MARTIRIASGSGFWGDWLAAPAKQVRSGPIDYLVMDYLAELTMSILVRQREKNPERGYAHDFVTTLEPLLGEIAKKGIKVISNAGGINPGGCARALKAVVEARGLADKLPIYFVDGDNLMPQLDRILGSGCKLTNIDTGQRFETIRSKILSANAYLGSEPIVEALQRGAAIVITGRVADASLAVAPLVFEFGSRFRSVNGLALATIAGHLIECGAQASGGNLSLDWETVPDPANIGFPIIEAAENGDIIITKHPKLGGRVDCRSVKEQLIYEIGDPAAYITPDVTADFTSVALKQVGPDRVALVGGRGLPATGLYKVSAAYFYGYKTETSLVFSWPDAAKKARVAAKIFKQRIAELGLELESVLTEIIGAGACHGAMVPESDIHNLPEVLLRIAARGAEKNDLRRFSRELIPLVLGGPPGATGYTGPRAPIEEIYGYWPALVPKEFISPRVTAA